MSGAALLQLVLLGVVLWCTVPLLGRYLAAVYGPTGRRSFGDRLFAPIERAIYRMLRVDPDREQRWNVYVVSLLAFSLLSFLTLYVLLRVQEYLPFNATGVPNVAPFGAFNVAVSFMTNTNWQCGMPASRR